MTLNSSPKDLDRVLSGYFQGAMPRTFPGAPVVDAEPSTVVAERAPSRRGSSASRWALAASVALMLGVSWYAASGTMSGPKPQMATQKSDLDKAKAGDGDILDEISKFKATGELP